MKKNKKISILDKHIECAQGCEGYPIITKYPQMMVIEVNNACDLRCVMCSYKDMKRKIGFMSEELYNKIMEQAKELKIKNFGLQTIGEPFLHPKIFDFIKTAKDIGIEYVYIITNGQQLDEDKIQKIIDSGLDSIKFSIDAASKETYEKTRVGGNWEKLLENIKLLRKLRDKTNSKLNIFGSVVITKDNYPELQKYASLFRDLVDESLISFVSNQGGRRDDESDSMIPKIIKENLDKLNLPKEKQGPCNMLWNRFVITYDGMLTTCCVDPEADELVYGDLSKNTLKECWNNDQMQRFRKIHKERRFESLPLCGNCDWIKRDKEVINRLILDVSKLNNLPPYLKCKIF